MSAFAVLLLCVQACLFQNVFSQCAGRISSGYGSSLASSYGGGSGLISGGCAAGLSTTSLLGAGLIGAYGNAGSIAGTCGNTIGSYGGIGNGEVIVLGELPIKGATAVSGRVPATGLVRFGGLVPASGSVSISGNCGCGCASY